jgi:ApaG protein
MLRNRGILLAVFRKEQVFCLRVNTFSLFYVLYTKCAFFVLLQKHVCSIFVIENSMPASTTHDVRVHVETQYQPDQSNPVTGDFLFAYRITIENNSGHIIQLLRRHWFIFDSSGETREVEGEGVVGVQPILKPGEAHAYISACNLKSDIGKMSGIYLFERLHDGHYFEVEIPEFTMMVPQRLS